MHEDKTTAIMSLDYLECCAISTTVHGHRKH